MSKETPNPYDNFLDLGFFYVPSLEGGGELIAIPKGTHEQDGEQVYEGVVIWHWDPRPEARLDLWDGGISFSVALHPDKEIIPYHPKILEVLRNGEAQTSSYDHSITPVRIAKWKMEYEAHERTKGRIPAVSV